MNRRKKLKNDNVDTTIEVCGKLVRSTESEKLLGLVINGGITCMEKHGGLRKRITLSDLYPSLSKELASSKD